MTDNEDQNLITRYFQGEEKALENLIQKYLRPIFNFVYRFTNNTQDAEDLTQEVFVRVWQNLKRLDRQRSFKTWLFSVAKNAAIDFLRKKKVLYFSEFEDKKGNNPIIDSLADPSPLPQEIFECQSIAADLNRVIGKLPPQYRLILLLHYNDHFTFQEIAETTGEPLNTIKSRHRRALIFLKELLQE